MTESLQTTATEKSKTSVDASQEELETLYGVASRHAVHNGAAGMHNIDIGRRVHRSYLDMDIVRPSAPELVEELQVQSATIFFATAGTSGWHRQGPPEIHVFLFHTPNSLLCAQRLILQFMPNGDIRAVRDKMARDSSGNDQATRDNQLTSRECVLLSSLVYWSGEAAAPKYSQSDKN